jgi:membrane fusion protein (multidrug efflux system)
VLAGIVYGLLWLFVFSVREKTDDAYVSGNLVTVTPQVAGTVVAIMADETQLVEAGNPVVRLDPADASVALDQARTALAEAVRQVRQSYEQALQSTAVIGEREADLQRARQDYERRLPLARVRAVPAEEVAHAKNALDSAQAALTAAQKQAQAAKAVVEGTSIEHHPSVERAKANFRQAWLNARRNELVAPVTGYVAKRSVQVGQRVVPGTALMSIVPLADLWVDANFKERELRDIRIGQPATVEADIYGGHVEYHGRVVGLGAGTGSAFSLLPPQNASGNWIKVVQRVPVRISLDRNELTKNPLRVGLSTTVTVDTHDRSGPVLAQTAANTTPYSTDVYDESHGEVDRIADDIVRANLGPPLPATRAGQ